MLYDATKGIKPRLEGALLMKNDQPVIPDLATLRDAHQRVGEWAHQTPTLTCQSIDNLAGSEIFFKCENLQKVGAFKFRGATNAVFSLPDQLAKRGVATHSSGNHAQALALAARNRGIDAHVVMPSNSTAVKVAAVAGYGAEISPCEPNLQAREETLEAVVARTRAVFIHPYNDYRIIAGQATAAIELLEEAGNLDIVMAPVGGGGLLSGTALAVKYLSPTTRVIAGEPAGADDAFRSLEQGRILPSVAPKTIADGLLTSLGELTFPIIRDNVERIVLVSEPGIISAMRLIWERMKLLVEPSSAVPLAAIMENKAVFANQRVGVIVSGGNVDLEKLPW